MWFALVALLIVAIAAVLVARLGQAPAPCLPHAYERPPRPGTFAARAIEPLPPVVRDPPTIEAQSAEWRAAMGEIGGRLRRAGVRRVIFVHGTFVGHDPTTVFGALEGLLAALSPPLVLGLKQLTKAPSDRVLGDLGNYTPEYVALFEAATGVAAERYVWCSANHHFARLRGAARLLGLLADAGRARLLLIGHSHAAQLFALFTQLVYPARTAPRLWALLCEAGEPVGRLAAAARAAARARIDIATFGGPPRYSWAPSRRCRVVHVINHRGAEPRAGALGGALYTEGGDYVQQLGIAGSDVPPGSARERELTARLDAILGAGCDPRAWREHLRHGARVPHHGFTWLVDYGDRACFRTASGRSSGTASTPPTRRCCSTPACWRTTSTVDTRVIAALESALGGCEDDSDDAPLRLPALRLDAPRRELSAPRRAGGLGEGPVRTFRQLRRIVATTPRESVGMTRRVGLSLSTGRLR